MLVNKGFAPTSILKVSVNDQKKTPMTANDLWRLVVLAADMGRAERQPDGSIRFGDEYPYVIADSANPTLVNFLKRMGVADGREHLNIHTSTKKIITVSPSFEFLIHGDGRENAKNLVPGTHRLAQASGKAVDITSVDASGAPGPMMWIETSSNTFDIDGVRAFFFE